MRPFRILVVDDESIIRELCRDVLSEIPGASVVCEERANRAVELLSTNRFDLLITDILMPDMDGIQLTRLARESHPQMLVIVITGSLDLGHAVECLRLGASDYVLKPLMVEDLLASVGRLTEMQHLKEENQLLRRRIDGPKSDGDTLVGKSQTFEQLRESIARFARSDVDVLIEGETGTGKELVARAIHDQSYRSEGPFVPVDCGALPENLMESEFFGHERGAFTGADQRTLGLMEYADGGTLFLDEIGELPLRMQTTLLRALQERKIRRVGGREEVQVDIRILAATNRDLASAIASKKFRADLYYRVRVGEIRLPPLRGRQDDIKELAQHFLAQYHRDINGSVKEFDPEVTEVLSRYPWPGNVRELINTVKRMLAVSDSNYLTVNDMPRDILSSVSRSVEDAGSGFFPARELVVAEFERRYLRDLLASCGGDVSMSGRKATIPRRTLYRLLKKYDIDPVGFRIQPVPLD